MMNKILKIEKPVVFLKNYWNFVGSPTLLFLICITLSVIYSLLNISTIGILLPLIEILISDNSGATGGDNNFKFGEMINLILGKFGIALNPINLFSIAIIGLGFGYAVKLLKEFIANKISIDALTTIRHRIVTKVFNAKIPYFQQTRYGDLSNSMILELHRAALLIKLVADCFHNILMVVFFSIFMLLISFYLSLVYFVLLILIYMIITFAQSNLVKFGTMKTNSYSDLQDDLIQNLLNFKSIKADNNEKRVINYFTQKGQTTDNLERRILNTQSIIGVSMEPIIILVVLILVAIGSQLLSLSASEIIIFVLALWRANSPAQQIVSTLGQMKVYHASFNKIWIEYVNSSKLQETQVSKYKNFAQQVSEIKFQDVSFSHNLIFSSKLESNRTPSLKNLNFQLNAGDMVAIVGPSGSGKSTIIELLLKLWEPSAGMISMNGINIQLLPREKYLRKFSAFLTDAALQPGTIKNNLVNSEDNKSWEDIRTATKLAECYNFIDELDKKFDAEISSTSKLLSKGQQQRILLAKTLLKSSEILVLDEPTSALDTQIEIKIMRKLREKFRNKIKIIVTHNQANAELCDKILVIENGAITGIGTHQSLIKTNDFYSKMGQ